MKCNNCNAELPENAKFCLQCGNKVEIHSHCVNCGRELPPNAKFCFECGTPIGEQLAVVNSDEVSNEPREDLFWITSQQLNNLIRDDLILLSIDSVSATNDNVDVSIDSDGDVLVEGMKNGNSTVYVDFTYRESRNRQPYRATMECSFRVGNNYAVELKEYDFINTADEEGESQTSDTWEKVGSFVKGAAEFLGGFAAGWAQGQSLYDDDDD